jgi:uncharacterized membrane protein YqjE
MALLESAQTLLASVAALARTRLALFGTELQEELTRLLFALLGGMLVLLLIALGAAFGGLALVISLGEEHRTLAAGLIALAFVVLAGAVVWGVRRLVRAKPRPFDASLTELERDYEALKP